MYLKLKESLVLRGWDRLPFALQDLKSGETMFLSETDFQGISFCNGMLDIDSPVILEGFRTVAMKAKEKGIVEECSDGDGLKDYQEYRLAPCRFIRRAHWSITGKCNLKCRHCYMSAPQGKYGELSLDKCLDIVRQLKDANIAQISLTGGEPLVRKDFFDIVDALIACKIVIRQVYSNGVLVNKKLLDEFEKREIKPEFSLSFDGIGQHDWLRGVAGAEKSVIEAMKLLIKRGFDVGIETSLHKGNINTLNDMMKLFYELGVKHWKTSPASDSGNWLNEGGKYNIDAKTLYETYLDFIPQYRKAGAPLSIMLGGFFMCNKGSEKYSIPCKKYDGTDKMSRQTLCASARTTMYISADGKLLPCIPLTGLPIQDEMPSLNDIPLVKALSDSAYMSRIDTRLSDLLDKNKKCRECEYKLFCGGGCRAGALITSGEYLGCDDWTCYFFKNKYEEKIQTLYA